MSVYINLSCLIRLNEWGVNLLKKRSAEQLFLEWLLLYSDFKNYSFCTLPALENGKGQVWIALLISLTWLTAWNQNHIFILKHLNIIISNTTYNHIQNFRMLPNKTWTCYISWIPEAIKHHKYQLLLPTPKKTPLKCVTLKKYNCVLETKFQIWIVANPRAVSLTMSTEFAVRCLDDSMILTVILWNTVLTLLMLGKWLGLGPKSVLPLKVANTGPFLGTLHNLTQQRNQVLSRSGGSGPQYSQDAGTVHQQQ